MEILNFNVVRFCVFDFPILIMLEVLYIYIYIFFFLVVVDFLGQ